MNTEKKLALAALLVGLIALGVGIFGGGKTVNTVRETVREIVGATPGGTFTNPVEVLDRFVRIPRIVSTTTTGSSATLVANDLMKYDSHVVILGGALDTNFTYTLPASSTLTGFVDKLGAQETHCWYNVASSTSNHRLVFAAGTGIDLAFATSTQGTAVPAILGPAEANWACIDFVRQARDNQSPNTGTTVQLGDITAILRITSDAD